MVKDQLFFMLPREMQVHVKESIKHNLSNMIKIASSYTEAHNLNESDEVDNKKMKQEINNSEVLAKMSRQSRQE